MILMLLGVSLSSFVMSASIVSLASIADVIQIGFFPATVLVEILASSLFLSIFSKDPDPLEMLTSLIMTLLFLFITFHLLTLMQNISPVTTDSSRTLKAPSSVLVVCANPLNGSLSENSSQSLTVPLCE